VALPRQAAGVGRGLAGLSGRLSGSGGVSFHRGRATASRPGLIASRSSTYIALSASAAWATQHHLPSGARCHQCGQHGTRASTAGLPLINGSGPSIVASVYGRYSLRRKTLAPRPQARWLPEPAQQMRC